MALAPSRQRARPGFLDRVLRFAIPAGLVAGVATLAGFQVSRVNDNSLTQDRTTALITLFLVAFWVLALLARPFNTWRAGLVGSMGGAFFLALGLPRTREFFDIELPGPTVLVEAVLVAAAACLLLELGWHLAHWIDRRWGEGDGSEDGGQVVPVLVPQTVNVDTSPLRQVWDRWRNRRGTTP